MSRLNNINIILSFVVNFLSSPEYYIIVASCRNSWLLVARLLDHHAQRRMLSSLTRRVPRQRVVQLAQPRRSASGTPHYNEPSGWLFGEKVSARLIDHNAQLLMCYAATPAGTETPTRELGDELEYWHVWKHVRRCCTIVLQAGYEASLVQRLFAYDCNVYSAVYKHGL